jgi:methylglyoxal reductase
MQFRTLGNSDLRVPVVSFGAWAIGGWMWGGTDDNDAVTAIHKAIDSGMTLIDTAPSYGMGHSETIVGKAIRGKRDKVLIATKCGIRWNLEGNFEGMDTKDNDGKPVKLVRHLKADSIRYECEQSLKRLGIECIDLYQCHWPDPRTPLEETMEALEELRTEGKIRAIGMSNFTVEMMQTCMANGQIVSDQPKYNPLEREIEKDVLPFCLKNNIGVLAYSPIAQGLMTGKVAVDRTFKEGDARATRPLFTRENRQRALDLVAAIKPIADARGITLAQLAIAWVTGQPGITTAIVGARTAEQVSENAGAGEVVLGEEELRGIRQEIFAKF